MRTRARTHRQANGSAARIVISLLILAAGLERGAAAQWVGLETQVNAYTTASQEWSAVASTSGGFVVVWHGEGTEDGNGVYGRRFDATGAADGDQFPVNTETELLQEIPSVIGDDAGGFFVAWTSYQQDGSGAGVFGQRFDSTGAPVGAELPLATTTLDDQKGVRLAAAPGGEIAAVWWSLSQDGSGAGVYTRRFDATGAALTGEERVNDVTANWQWQPAIAHAGSGEFVVAWSSNGQDGSGEGVFARRVDALGAPVGAEIPVNQHTAGEQTAPAIACDAAGNFVVVWTSVGQDGSAEGVYGRHFDASGAPTGDERRIHVETLGEQSQPEIAFDGEGGYLVTWQGSDTDGYGILARRLDALGAPAGAEFAVNTHVTSSQTRPAVSATAAGELVVTWNSSFQIGVGEDVFAQRIRRALFEDSFENGDVCGWTSAAGGSGACP